MGAPSRFWIVSDQQRYSGTVVEGLIVIVAGHIQMAFLADEHIIYATREKLLV